jgi:LPS-assembly lipoprotein
VNCALSHRSFPLLALIVLVVVSTLAGCGFQLRGNRELPFSTLYVKAPETSQLTPTLRRALRGGTQVKLVDNPADAEVTLEIIREARERQILSLSNTGRVSEYRLDYYVQFRLYQKEKEYLPPTNVSQWRAMSFQDSQVIQREGQEDLLYRDMRNDAVQQIVRRVAAVKPDAS